MWGVLTQDNIILTKYSTKYLVKYEIGIQLISECFGVIKSMSN